MGIPVDSLMRLSVSVTDSTGTLVDPTTVTLTVQDPTGSKTTYSAPAHDGLGKYHQDVDTTGKAGTWLFEWKSTGAAQGAVFGEAVVDASLLG